jgi:hypothetical protein
VAIVSRQRREEPQNPDARRKHTWKVNQERREPYMLTTKIIGLGAISLVAAVFEIVHVAIIES